LGWGKKFTTPARIAISTNRTAYHAFGQFFKTLEYIAEKAGSAVIPEKPAYTSMVLGYRNEIIFTDCGIRDYWDEQNSLMVAILTQQLIGKDWG